MGWYQRRVHAGVAPQADLEPNTDIKYHKWYQWTAFFLFLQVVFFHLPRTLWKSSEAGKVNMLVGGLQDPLLDASKKEEQISEIVKYFRMHRGTHTLYALRFFWLGSCQLYQCHLPNLFH